MLKILLMLIFFTSCASAGDWSEWRHCGVAQEDQDWRWCSEDKDGPEYHMKGYCYIENECRTRRTVWPFRNLKTENRNKVLFCKFGDIDCMIEHRVFDSGIKPL